MNSRSLTGWCLVLGPLLMFIIWGLLDPLVIGDASGEGLSPSEETLGYLELAAAKPVVANLFGFLGSLAMIATIAGFTWLSRSIKGAGATWASIPGFIFPALAAVAIGFIGLSISAQDLFADGFTAAAAQLEVVGNNLGGGFGLFWGIGALFLGTALTCEKNIPAFLGWVLTITGLIMVVTSAFSGGQGGTFGFIIWIVMSLATIGVGINILRGNADSGASSAATE